MLSLFNFPYTLVVALAASALGVLRVCKNPSFSQAYLGVLLQNNHGQNIFYIVTGCMGFINYLYYAPLTLFFAYGIVEYIKISYPASAFNYYGDMVRANRQAVLECKGRLELFFFIYLLITLPLDFGRVFKVLIMGQFLLVKYRLNT